MPRTAIGHARYECHNEIVYHRLDFEGRTGTFKIERARGQNGDLGRPKGPSVTEMLYLHGFASPLPRSRSTAATATVECGLSRPPPVAGGRAGGRPSISRRDGGDGVAAVVTVEGLRVGSAL